MGGGVLLVSVLVALVGGSEPSYSDYFQRDFKLLEALAELDARQDVLEEKIQLQTTTIADLQQQLRAITQDVWGTWSSWSACTMNCTGDSSGRVQYRSRQYLNPEAGERSETESRPCNAVQFAGCIKTSSPDDNFGIVYDFKDQIAIAACTAISTGAYNYAVRRQCSAQSVPCSGVCESVGLTCFESLHIYGGQPVLRRDETAAKSLMTYRYKTCSNGGCGPNFCCCK